VTCELIRLTDLGDRISASAAAGFTPGTNLADE